MLRSELSTSKSKQESCEQIIVFILPKLDYQVHHEVMSSLLMIFNDLVPTFRFISSFLLLSENFVEFVACILLQIDRKDPSLLASVISDFLVSLEDISQLNLSLYHLDFFCYSLKKRSSGFVEGASSFSKSNPKFVKSLELSLKKSPDNNFINLQSFVSSDQKKKITN